MTLSELLRERLRNPELMELLASIEHDRWSTWQRYVHERCERQEDGSLLIPVELAEHWERQVSTPYCELSEDERESDREQVRKYLPTLIDFLAKTEENTT